MSIMSQDTIRRFEEKIAEYAGSKFAVSVDSCCNAILLSCYYVKKTSLRVSPMFLPYYTYPGVACAVINSGNKVKFNNISWKGIYKIKPYNIIDGALRFKKGMYEEGFHCLSFHVKKHLPIGRGGMILTNDQDAYTWFKRARFDGRNQVPLNEDYISIVGWNCYMTSEQAARGLTLFDVIKDKDLPDMDSTKQNYPDLSKIKAYQ